MGRMCVLAVTGWKGEGEEEEVEGKENQKCPVMTKVRKAKFAGSRSAPFFLLEDWG
jgi:hypothetical protein